jgi:hypothetical protein
MKPPGICRRAVTLSEKPKLEMRTLWKLPTAPLGMDAAVVMSVDR